MGIKEGGERKKTAEIRILSECAKGQIMFNNLSNFMRYKYDDSHVMTSFSSRIEGALGHLDNGAEAGNRMRRIAQGDRLLLLGSWAPSSYCIKGIIRLAFRSILTFPLKLRF